MKLIHHKVPRIAHRELYYLAWRNIVSKRLRTALTISGIVVGIGSIGFLLSFGLGLQNLVTKNIIGNKSIKSIEVVSPNSRIVKLNADAVNKMRLYPGIEKLGVQYSYPASIGYRGGGIDAVVYGVDKQYQDITNINLLSGRLLKESSDKEVIISQSTLKTIGLKDDASSLNSTISIVIPLQYANASQNQIKADFTIVGIMDSGQNNELFVSSSIFDVAGVPTYKQVKLIAKDTKSIPNLRRQIESGGFYTSSPVDTLDQINQLFKFFNLILGGFGAIGILVAILGMFNTLTISLLERTREIGLMITLGGRPIDMWLLFMIESVLLSLMGSAIGVGLAIVGGKVANYFINSSAAGRIREPFTVFSMPLYLILALVGFMVVVGILVAFFPAQRAHRISPIDALRRE